MTDQFSFIFATDIHLGHRHDATIDEANDDPFNAFEEILQKSRADNIDCLLLGGDLFHTPHPSLSDRLKTRTLLQKYVLGEKDDDEMQGIYENFINYFKHGIALEYLEITNYFHLSNWFQTQRRPS